jgi:hypothetical protein
MKIFQFLFFIFVNIEQLLCRFSFEYKLLISANQDLKI